MSYPGHCDCFRNKHVTPAGITRSLELLLKQSGKRCFFLWDSRLEELKFRAANEYLLRPHRGLLSITEENEGSREENRAQRWKMMGYHGIISVF